MTGIKIFVGEILPYITLTMFLWGIAYKLRKGGKAAQGKMIPYLYPCPFHPG